jgi:hypothetical protein
MFNIPDPASQAYTAVGKRGYVESQCKCALTDETTGYCSSVLGTSYYRDAVRAMRIVLAESKCHTQDRNNLRAQKDDCGIGMKNEEWRFAVDKMFNVTHWENIHKAKQYHCV